jgi:hypothetical protein
MGELPWSRMRIPGADEQLLRKPLVKYAKEVDVDTKIHAR